MKALLALGMLGLVPWLGYDLDATRATAFHFMAVGQLLLTYPSRHTWTHPFPNLYLHAAVLGGIGIQLAAAWLPFSATSWGTPTSRSSSGAWCSAGRSWRGDSRRLSRLAWRHHARAGIGR